MNFANRWRLVVALPALLAVAACAVTAGRVTQKKAVAPIDAPEAVALDGYDPVAYFIAGEPTQGAADIAYEWRGARWQFASQANRDAFAAEPERYAPQYGGYCSYAMAHGYIARGNPFQWAIVENKLYVNNNAFAMTLWDKDRPGHIVAGDANWPLIPKLPLANEQQVSAR